MIESSFLTSSPWDQDVFQDFGFVSDISSLQFEEPSYEFENENFKLSGSSTPIDICSSSSDCLLLDDFDEILPVSDTFVSQILEDHNATGFSDLDWLTLNESPNNQDDVNNTTDSDERSCRSNPIDKLLTAKLWSKMSPEDQINTLHALSDAVTYHMSILEQMEVIKVLDPDAVITPEDKEFTLDIGNLNDIKLQKIKEYIRKHIKDSQLRSLATLKNTKKSNSTKLISRKTSHLNYSRTKRKQKKSKAVHSKDKLKRLKQTNKEKKSGLFVYEKKMKLSVFNPSEEDEDVNILE